MNMWLCIYFFLNDNTFSYTSKALKKRRVEWIGGKSYISSRIVEIKTLVRAYHSLYEILINLKSSVEFNLGGAVKEKGEV